MLADVQSKSSAAWAAQASPDTKVALVDDNAQLRRQRKQRLTRSPGVSCVGACGSAEEALQEIPPATPDVVLMDSHLPEIFGIDGTTRLQHQMPALRVSIFNALKAGARGCLLKRSSGPEILDAVTAVRQGRGGMTGEIARKAVMTFQTSAPWSDETVTFSSRGQEVLEMLSQGMVNKEIADKHSISYHTAWVHLKHACGKLHVRSRNEARLRFMSDKHSAALLPPRR